MNMSKEQQYLFLFTIGPVKQFIANSRKAQDLFAGSGILSHLTGIAMNKAKDVFGHNIDIITPTEDNPFKPNRFVATISDSDAETLKTNAKKIEDAVNDSFKNISQIAFNNSFTIPVGFDEQLNDFLNIEWLFLPIVNGYKETYKQLFKELAAIKNLQKFEQQSETGRKCNVDGEMNVKVYRKKADSEKLTVRKSDKLLNKLYQKEDEVKIIDHNDEKKLKIWHVQEGEGLSAVSLTKRIFNPQDIGKLSQPHQFPSTVQISLMDLFSKIKDFNEFKVYKKKVVGDTINASERLFKHSDDQLYYQENIQQIVEKQNSNRLTDIESLHKELRKRIKREEENKNSKLPFTKYYALIRFDGDNMGDWLIGKNLKDDTDLEEYHKTFTRCVSDFAAAMDEVLSDPKGKLVYAGGEDFMAFVNIHHLFTVLKKIRSEYDERINKKLEKYRKTGEGSMTISVGIAIAHYKQPLSMVLAKAKEMETKAKNNNRNSFAIGVMKHSGTNLDCVFKWNKGEIKPLELIEKVVESVNKNFSPAFITNIYRAFEEYGFNMSHDLVHSKINVFVARAASDSLIAPKEKAEIIGSLKKTLIDLCSINGNNDHQDFGNALLIADFLTRRTK